MATIARALAVLLAAMSVIAPAAASRARPAPSEEPETFDSFGPPADGRIDRMTWLAHEWAAALRRYDANGDGRITAAEFTGPLCAMSHGDPRCAQGAEIFFLSLDRNRNGLLDRPEMDAWSGNLFRRNDRNHDGYVTREEMAQTAEGR